MAYPCYIIFIKGYMIFIKFTKVPLLHKKTPMLWMFRFEWIERLRINIYYVNFDLLNTICLLFITTFNNC